uniref:Capsid protein n=1 Tax=Cressdnaviricota sp. TaxID=2748378 RepID=A0A6M9Z7V8_9VIRU|nr:MAG: capsid protein [Cressdnaviricota sp.]QKN88879.1 MAG: capsid protein [Cressdnaviricota sp.]
MPSYKRKRSSSVASRKPYAKRARTAKRTGRTGLAGILSASVRRANAGVKRLTNMIETKESTQVTGSNQSLPHNVLYDTGINVMTTNIGASDPMSGTGQRIGDSVSIRGLLLKGMFENALNRSRVNYKIMLIRCAKGDSITTATLYKGIVGNKLIDQVNTERFSIVASKKFTINCTNGAASSVGTSGVPAVDPLYNVGIGTKVWSMWIPGAKFGRNGTIKYENQSTSQVKFYDYKLVIMTYDWFGTPTLVGPIYNNVGKINEMYSKLYYKDA